jgi:hypothetical protein
VGLLGSEAAAAVVSVDYAEKHASMRERVLELLADCEWHTHRELHSLCNRYGARIAELRGLGYVVETEDLDAGKRYRLVSLDRSGRKQKRVRVYLDERDVVELLKGRLTLFSRAALEDALGSFRQNKERL